MDGHSDRLRRRRRASDGKWFVHVAGSCSCRQFQSRRSERVGPNIQEQKDEIIRRESFIFIACQSKITEEQEHRQRHQKRWQSGRNSKSHGHKMHPKRLSIIVTFNFPLHAISLSRPITFSLFLVFPFSKEANLNANGQGFITPPFLVLETRQS